MANTRRICNLCLRRLARYTVSPPTGRTARRRVSLHRPFRTRMSTSHPTPFALFADGYLDQHCSRVRLALREEVGRIDEHRLRDAAPGALAQELAARYVLEP